MAKSKGKKKKTALVVVSAAIAAVALLGGTLAWQSISQVALNENQAEINPGARLHDDYNGKVKNVYVENFTTDNVKIIARVRLDEYMEIGGAAGYKSKNVTSFGNTVTAGANGVVRIVSETEDDASSPGSVTVKIMPIPHTNYKVKEIKVGGVADTTTTPLMTDGVYTYTKNKETDGSYVPAEIEVVFEADGGTPYDGDTIDPAVPLVKTVSSGSGSVNTSNEDVGTWETYIPKVNATTGALEVNSASPFRKYVTLTFGAKDSIYYMPTFNMNKDSLKADINGTYAGTDGDAWTGTPYDDYHEYTKAEQKTADEIWDADFDSIDEGDDAIDNVDIKKVNNTHTTKEIAASKSKVISMKQWIDDYKQMPGDYWIYDEDGWAYWGNLLDSEDVTGLLLSGNEMTGTPEDNWYYGMNVVAQFVTPGDIGDSTSGTGFYNSDKGKAPSTKAKVLLSVLSGLNESKTVQMTSGEELDVTYLKTNAVAPTSLTESDGSRWTVSDDSVVVLYEKESKVYARGIKPGEALISYSAGDGTKAATIRVTVESGVYTITSANSAAGGDAATVGALTYSETEAANDTVTIKGSIEKTETGSDNNQYKVYMDVAIAENAFENAALKLVTIEKGVLSMGSAAFKGCTTLKQVTINAELTAIPDEAFSGCIALDDGALTLPATVTTIGKSAFDGCTTIDSFTISDNVTSLGADCFKGTAITAVTYAGTTSEWNTLLTNCGGADAIGLSGSVTVTCSDSSTPSGGGEE